MQLNHTKTITLSDNQRAELESIIRKRNSAQALVLRSRIILAAADGVSIKASVRSLGCNRETVRLWRKRWVNCPDDTPVMERFKEASRSGAPAKFTAEQICEIIAMACDKPEDHGYPFSHWSENSLAMASVDKGIVSSISQRQVGRFLKSGRYSARQGRGLD